MAHIRCDFRSEVMDMNTSMTVVLPEAVDLNKVKVVYLLHGLADNCTGWSRYTCVERYAREYNLALVIPEVQRSFYADMVEGLSYFKFIHEELRDICCHFFNFSKEKENNYIMGLSMGGYGALKCALTTPTWYNGCAAFSSVADIKTLVKSCSDGRKTEFDAIFGNTVGKESDLFELLAINKEKLPSFYISCGEEDVRIVHSKKIVSVLQEKDAKVQYEHWTGDHNWVFWDEAVKRAFAYFFGKE